MTTPAPTTSFSPTNGTLNPGQPIQIWYGGSGIAPFVANNDFANTLYVGAKADVLRQDISSTIPFYPLGGMAMADVDIWAFVPETAKPNSYLVIPGATSWTPSPVQVQLALNAAGLATAANQVVQNTSINAPAYGPPTHTDVAATTTAVNAPAYGPPTHTDVLGTTTAVNAPAYGPPTHTDVAATTTAVNAPAYGPATHTDILATTTAVNSPAYGPATHADVITTSPLNTANNIATTGAPPIILSTSTINTGTQVIVASGTYTNPVKTIGQPGYEIFVNVKCSNTSVAPFVRVQLSWTDSISGQIVAVDNWYLAGGSAAFQSYMGTGPTKGNQLTLSVLNYDGTNSTSISVIMLQNSRTYVRDDWRNQSYGAVPGWTNGTEDIPGNIVMATQPSVPGTGTVARICPLYSGLVQFSFDNLSTVGACSFQVMATANAESGLANDIVYQSPTVAASGVLNGTFALPRGVCVVILANAAATAQNLQLVMVASEQAI